MNEDFVVEPAFNDKDSINIVFCPDNNYAKYFGVLLRSIIDNSNPKRKYDLLVFANDISERNKFLLKNMLPDNFSLRFIDVTDYVSKNFSECKFKAKGYWSIATFYRLFIPFIMPDYEKVMYLDTDMCTNYSIEELFDIDFGNKALIAVTDTVSSILDVQPERKNYMVNTLKLVEPKNYFNAGFVIFNLKNINCDSYKSMLLSAFKTKDFWFLDQDIMNIIFDGCVKLVHNKWNFMLDSFGYSIFKANITGDYKRNYIEASKNPYIVHYSGPRKPWDYFNDEYAEIFWHYARKTPFYEQLLFNVFRKTILEILKPDWFKYYEYKMRSSLPGKKQKHYIDKFNKIHLRFKNIGLISK